MGSVAGVVLGFLMFLFEIMGLHGLAHGQAHGPAHGPGLGLPTWACPLAVCPAHVSGDQASGFGDRRWRVRSPGACKATSSDGTRDHLLGPPDHGWPGACSGLALGWPWALGWPCAGPGLALGWPWADWADPVFSG